MSDAGDRLEAALVGGVVVTKGANVIERARRKLRDIFPLHEIGVGDGSVRLS